MAETLSPSQSAALLDILTHYDTYAEIRDFRYPGSLMHYGPPFTTEKGRPSSSPALQALISKFALTLPGLRDLSEDFWKVQIHDIMEGLEKANLSDSYDKGVIGSRKTLATAISALIEYPIRGTFGGFPKLNGSGQAYDTTKADDLARAFRDFLNGAVYGTILEDLAKKAAETDNLNDHSPLIKAVHEFVLVNLASFMHYTLILSPKGQYLLKLVDNTNKLVPYMVIRQTLKIGNVASMINAMMKVVLAKMSVASLTNWMGITQSKDEGMNLLQTIVSTVLNWDIKDLDSRAAKLERERTQQLGKDQLQSLKDYTNKPLEEQERIRKQSQNESISIVTAILRNTELESRLTEPHHKQALDYLSIHLSIRDRREIIQIFCRNNPDHLTQSVRDLVAAYEPVIRGMHNAIDLSSTVGDFENFLKDMIKLAKVRTTSKDTSEAIVPTVGDFVQLLRKHQRSSHTFIHQACKNGPELTSWYIEWGKKAAAEFKQQDLNIPSPPDHHPSRTAGDLTQPLNSLFSSLPSETRSRILPILDAQISFLDSMHSASRDRLSTLLSSPASRDPAITKILATPTTSRPPSPSPPSGTTTPSRPPPATRTPTLANSTDPSAPAPKVSSDPGPGSYLTRWQDLLDSTPITPLTQTGKPVAASDPEVVQKSSVDVDGTKLIQLASQEARGDKIRVVNSGGGKPDVKIVIEAMGDKFREVLGERGMWW